MCFLWLSVTSLFLYRNQLWIYLNNSFCLKVKNIKSKFICHQEKICYWMRESYCSYNLIFWLLLEASNYFHFLSLVTRQRVAFSPTIQRAMSRKLNGTRGTECFNSRLPLPCVKKREAHYLSSHFVFTEFTIGCIKYRYVNNYVSCLL